MLAGAWLMGFIYQGEGEETTRKRRRSYSRRGRAMEELE